MFLTAIEDFDYRPHIEHGVLVRGQVVTETALLWECEGKLPEGVGNKIVVQAGFVTDLASLPISGVFFKKVGMHQRAAVLHDYLYRNRLGSKRFADRQFLGAMKQDGVKRWRRNTMWLAVSLFGLHAWNRNKV
jgi:hypothetical protein